MNVTLSPRLQMQAATAAVLLALGLALSHVAAQTPEPPGNAQPAATAQNALWAADLEQSKFNAKLNERHVHCLAKVVLHEAGNQPREGKIAVAQVLMNRVKKGFGDNVCAVANQPGQFFRLNRYHPDRNSTQWAQAVDVARTVLAGEARDWSKGALYFHANWAKADRFFRSRTKVARLDDHDFYR